jgi:hypothetical protein
MKKHLRIGGGDSLGIGPGSQKSNAAQDCYTHDGGRDEREVQRRVVPRPSIYIWCGIIFLFYSPPRDSLPFPNLFFEQHG